jgi:LysM repeat protein
VTDRGSGDAPLACPFLAFEDDRDARSPRPDHRHRCFAEIRPAPRAIAHQERYCLTAGFVSCPTFLDWARREAAAVREPLRAGSDERAGSSGLGGSPEGEGFDRSVGGGAGSAAEDFGRRDWTAPPPWSRGEPGRPEEAIGPVAPMPPFLAGRETAGTAGAGSGSSPVAGAPGAAGSTSAGPVAAGPAGGRAAVGPAAGPVGGGPAVGGLGDRRAADDEELEAGALGTTQATVIDPGRRSRADRWGDVPPWERPRWTEAYPRLRTPIGLPAVSPLLLAAAAVVVAALALFFVPPMLLNLGGQAPASPSPSPTLASPSTSPSPTPTPVPTPLVYVVQSGDTLSKIAKRFGVSLDALIEANKDRITNPDRINIGDQIVIPTPPPEVVPGQSSPAASEAPPSPAP